MEYNAENYRKELAQIESEMEERKKNLMRIYAGENNPYKRGEIIKDNSGSIVIEKISVSMYFGERLPVCQYYGPELKKDGTPRKDGSKRWVHQTNILKS